MVVSLFLYLETTLNPSELLAVSPSLFQLATTSNKRRLRGSRNGRGGGEDFPKGLEGRSLLRAIFDDLYRLSRSLLDTLKKYRAGAAEGSLARTSSPYDAEGHGSDEVYRRYFSILETFLRCFLAEAEQVRAHYKHVT